METGHGRSEHGGHGGHAGTAGTARAVGRADLAVGLAQLSLDRHGPVGDRRLMVVANDVVDDYNVADICLPFLTQRQEPRMALIRAALSADGRSVQLSMAGRPDLTTDLPGPAGPSLLVRVWRHSS